LESSGLNATVNQSNLTLFAPTDTAFNQLPPVVLTALQQPALSPILVAIMNYHVSPTPVSVNSLRSNSSLFIISNVPGFDLLVTRGTRFSKTMEFELYFTNDALNESNNTLVNRDATVVQPDLQSSTAIVQGIDKVLSPTSLLFGVGLSQLSSQASMVTGTVQPVSDQIFGAINSASDQISGIVGSPISMVEGSIIPVRNIPALYMFPFMA
jgi:hypothetical protein